MKTFWISLFLLVLTSSLDAKTIEIQKMSDIYSYITPRTLVVFDIDNTLVHPPQDLGTDQSWKWMKSEYMRAGLNEEQATAKALKYWQRVQHFTSVRPVDQQTPGLVAQLQARKIPTMALTARSSNIAKRTLEQLKSVGIGFKNSSLLTTTTRIPVQGKYAVHTNGVIFASGANKGAILANLLKMTNSRPDRVIFVDDKRHHTEEVEHALRGKVSSVLTFRFGGADYRVKSFRPDVAKVQSYYLEKVLSNSDAQILLQSRK